LMAYRYVNDTAGGPNSKSALSELYVHEVTDTDARNHLVGIKRPAAATVPSGATKVELFRSVSVDVAGTVYEGGVLYKEKEISTSVWNTWTTHQMGTLPDEVLVQQARYDPLVDAVGTAPRTATIHTYQGIVFMEGENGESLVWSNVRALQPENFNALNSYPCPRGTGRLLRIMQAEDDIYVLGEQAILRVMLAGSRVLIKKVHSTLGLAYYRAVEAVGADLIFLSTKGLAILNGTTGQALGVAAASRVVDLKKWTSSDVYVVTDSRLGATFVVGGDYPGITVDEETGDGAIVLWHDNKVMTMLVGMSVFAAAATGPHPVDGGGDRAIFITSDGIVVVPSLDLDIGPTMLGVLGTVNGTTTAGGDTYLEDSTAAFSETAVGSRVYLVDVDGAEYTVRKIVSFVNSTKLKLADLDGNDVTVSAGTVYTISPVPFRVTPRPFGGDFERVTLRSLAVHPTWTDADTTTGYFRLSALTGKGGRRLLPDVGDDGEERAMVAMSSLPERTSKDLLIGGPRVTVQVEAVSAGARFELTGAEASITLRVSKRSAGIS